MMPLPPFSARQASSQSENYFFMNVSIFFLVARLSHLAMVLGNWDETEMSVDAISKVCANDARAQATAWLDAHAHVRRQCPPAIATLERGDGRENLPGGPRMLSVA
jgi:hypothetical protein